MSILQPLEELERFYDNDDPWGYEVNPEDIKRKNIILSEIPERKYEKILDIGCGNGFITRDLPSTSIIGVDVSANAISQARFKQSHESNNKNIDFIQSSIFELSSSVPSSYDLIIITGVLYSQYIGESKRLVYLIVDKLLANNGILICSHINDWYSARFPYLMLENYYFDYREFTQCLEVYVK